MRIPFTATNFNSTTCRFPAKPWLNATWQDIVWSAITTGKPSRTYLLTHRWHSFAEQIVREFTVYANLRERASDYERSTVCEKSSLYDELDPTEKGATSYFMGMTMAKLIAFKFFDTPWLFHVSLAEAEQANIIFKPNTKSQPDLIGLSCSGNWIVVESKGRTNGFELDALIKAKQQTRMIKKINSNVPYLRVALQAYFNPTLSVYMDDPPEFDARAWDLSLDMGVAYTRYYSFYAALRNQPTGTVQKRNFAGRKFLTHTDRESGVTIGIDEEVIDLLSGTVTKDINKQMLKYSSNIQISSGDEEASIYPDGLLIELNSRWAKEQMLREPNLRGTSKPFI